MANRSRCHDCNHLRGPRALHVRGTQSKGKTGTQRKQACACVCHVRVLAGEKEREDA